MVTLSLAVFLGGAAAVILNRTLGMPWLGRVVSGAVRLLGMRRPFGRWRATRQRLPSEALRWLSEHVPLYRALGRAARAHFERDVQIVLAELRFEGVANAKATDELKLAVAPGAALFPHGRPDWDLPRHPPPPLYPRRGNERGGARGGGGGGVGGPGPARLGAGRRPHGAGLPRHVRGRG